MLEENLQDAERLSGQTNLAAAPAELARRRVELEATKLYEPCTSHDGTGMTSLHPS
jgi:hypothetical protein